MKSYIDRLRDSNVSVDVNATVEHDGIVIPHHFRDEDFIRGPIR